MQRCLLREVEAEEQPEGRKNVPKAQAGKAAEEPASSGSSAYGRLSRLGAALHQGALGAPQAPQPSFGAELARTGASWRMVAPGLCSVTEILSPPTHAAEGRIWLPGRREDGGGCSRAVPMAKGCWEGGRESSEAPKPEEARRGAGRQTHAPAPRAAPGSPRALQGECAAPPGLAQGRPVSQW